LILFGKLLSSHLPIIRLSTTGSGEKEKIVSKLNELLT
jgi:hypothetical protein